MTQPSGEELAAIAAALAAIDAAASSAAAPSRAARIAPWSLAMRLPELDLDDVRLLSAASSCSIRL